MEQPSCTARRCAIYTRKSSAEGLEQDFNSLHAQRDACESFIKSQAAEGWRLVKTAYDDGGLSGGTMERPGLQRLLADIGEKLIDVVVVYKVDRLTRSLADFAKMVEIFDSDGVSFVAVTQQFNTTTSMGRLTLNVLLSFASSKARRWPPPIPIDGGAAGVKLEGFPNAIILSFQKGVAIMPGRNSPNAAREVDGRYARLRKPRKPPTARFLIAQWVKAQVVRLKDTGMTFEQIAAELTAAGNGLGTTITDDRSASANGIGRPQFWPGYSITAMGCHKAWKAALSSQVSLTVDELRSVDNQRLEQLFMATQLGVLRGDPQAINAALRVLRHQERLNGYSAPEKVEHEVDGAFEMPPGAVEFEQILDALSPEKQTQLVELLKEAKAASETQ